MIIKMNISHDLLVLAVVLGSKTKLCNSLIVINNYELVYNRK